MQEGRLKNTSYNRYAGVLKQMFQMAVNDRIIAESPFERVATKWKRPQTPVRRIPTVAQFEAIIANVRGQRCSSHAEDTADFLEFLGLAGLGQAEAASLVWGDVDFERSRIEIRRHKTDVRFHVPIYPHLRPLMEQLKAEAGAKATPRAHVFKIKDAKKALTNACKRLGFPHFSQRNLRQGLIMRLWKAGIDKRLLAQWQGHNDNGEPLSQVYTRGVSSDDDEYERLQLAKLAAPLSLVRTEDNRGQESEQLPSTPEPAQVA